MKLHQKCHFKREFCVHLAANGWRQESDAAQYDRQYSCRLGESRAGVAEA